MEWFEIAVLMVSDIMIWYEFKIMLCIRLVGVIVQTDNLMGFTIMLENKDINFIISFKYWFV